MSLAGANNELAVVSVMPTVVLPMTNVCCFINLYFIAVKKVV